MVKFQTPSYNTFWDMNYCLVEKLTDRQTDRKRRIRAHRAICTGGLNNEQTFSLQLSDSVYSWEYYGTSKVFTESLPENLKPAYRRCHVRQNTNGRADNVFTLRHIQLFYYSNQVLNLQCSWPNMFSELAWTNKPGIDPLIHWSTDPAMSGLTGSDVGSERARVRQ